MIVSDLHNQIDHKVEKLKYMKLDLRQQKVKNKSQLPALNKQCDQPCAQGWWILLSGLWIMFVICLAGKWSF